MTILIHHEGDRFDLLDGKGCQAHVEIDADGGAVVIGPPVVKPSKQRVSGATLDNVRFILSRFDPGRLAELAREARKSPGGVRFERIARADGTCTARIK